MKKFFRWIPIMGLVIVSTGCAPRIHITSEPSGAALWVDEKHVEKTPVDYKIKNADKRDSLGIKLEKSGYQPVIETIKKDASGKFPKQQHFVLQPSNPAAR